MCASFTPKSEKEIVLEGLIPAKSICDIEVLEATDGESKSSGNKMITLKLKAFHEGREFIIFDYIIFGQPMTNGQQFKLRRSCDTFGILNCYNSGVVDAVDYKDKCGQAKISISSDKNGQHPDRNGIGEYLPRPITPF